MPKSKGSNKKGGSQAKKQRTGDRHRVYCAYIAKDDDDALTQLIGDCGTPLNIKWLYSRDGTFRHCGFVDFAARKEAASFVKKNGMEWKGRKIQVKHASSGGKAGGLTGKVTVYVTGVGTDDEAEFREWMGNCSNVRKIRFMTDDDGTFKNSAFIDFGRPGPADKFKENFDGVEWGDNTVSVRYANDSDPTVFVSGFASSMTDSKFKKFVGSSAKFINGIRWKNENTYCFVSFDTVTAMNTFFKEKHGTKYESRTISLRLATNNRKQRKQ